jgi:hypothetical protein
MTQDGLRAFLTKVMPVIADAFAEEALGLKGKKAIFNFEEGDYVHAITAITSSMALSAADGDQAAGSALLLEMIRALIYKHQKMAAGEGTGFSFVAETHTTFLGPKPEVMQ